MAFSQRLQEIRTGFARPFWVANVSELFERLSYYGVFSALALYLNRKLAFDTKATGSLAGTFGGAVWFLAMFGGAVADRLGFRRALSLAYLILAIAYFLLGSIPAPWFAPLRNAVPLWWLVLAILILPALGIAMVKPTVVGTTARASQENVRSIGYSIYYTLVNVGAAIGPYLASVTHDGVFYVASVSVLLMFFVVLLLFREPARSAEAPPPTIRQTAHNFWTVITNLRFITFLLIFSGFWIMYWQQYIALPLYLGKYVGVPEPVIERMLSTEALTVISLQILVSLLTRKVPPFAAITIGTLISSFSWLIVAAHAGVWTGVAALFVLALGEITLSPRYYEYVSRLAPPEQQGTYMGFAFVPIGIGSLVGGWLAGQVMHRFAEVQHRPTLVWLFFTGVGVVTAALLWIYDVIVKPVQRQAAAANQS